MTRSIAKIDHHTGLTSEPRNDDSEYTPSDGTNTNPAGNNRNFHASNGDGASAEEAADQHGASALADALAPATAQVPDKTTAGVFNRP